jgi:hypothetical protein
MAFIVSSSVYYSLQNGKLPKYKIQSLRQGKCPLDKVRLRVGKMPILLGWKLYRLEKRLFDRINPQVGVPQEKSQ